MVTSAGQAAAQDAGKRDIYNHMSGIEDLLPGHRMVTQFCRPGCCAGENKERERVCVHRENREREKETVEQQSKHVLFF